MLIINIYIETTEYFAAVDWWMILHNNHSNLLNAELHVNVLFETSWVGLNLLQITTIAAEVCVFIS